MTLTDRVVLLTGARRVGSAVAEAVAARGADVALTYNRSRDDAEATAKAVRAAGRRALVVKADVSKEDACDALIREVEREFRRLDVLLNMASLYESIPFDEYTPAQFDRQLGVDLRGTFLASRAAVPLMRRNGGGRIINFSDWLVASG